MNYSYKKRLKKELFENNFLEHNFQITYHIEFIEIILDNKYRYILSYDYPFKCPYFYINGYFYNHFLKLKNHHLGKILQDYHFECPCCSSMINFWSPTRMLKDFIMEYRKYKKSYQEIYNIYFIEKIVGKIIDDKYLILNIFYYL